MTRPVLTRWTGAAFEPANPYQARIAGEAWRQIPSAPSYSVSSLGRVRRTAITIGGGGSVRRPTGCLKQRTLSSGHKLVTLSEQNQPRTRLVHRLVAEAFLPPPSKGQDCVLHGDDDPSNNVPENLRWGNRTDNANDRIKRGRSARGEQVGGAKLDARKVMEIRRLITDGAQQRHVAERFGVSQSNVHMIVTGKTWSHV